ncbi:MAG: HAMP domain-containing histidine kinase [Tyzzerella sp.]|nr:HAMP domain-containing histidine kinase [Tyzzerella sp.]
MKNKVNLKRCLWQCLSVILVFLILFLGFQWKGYREYTSNYNRKMDAILREVREKYPDITKAELMEILNASEERVYDELEESFVDSFGIDLEKDSLILENETGFRHSLMLNGLFVILLSSALVGLFLKYNYNKDKELEQITRYIEEINQRNYKLEIDDISEDELSILKNEIYKTTVMLKETAENSMRAKNDLKESLSDISHQLKTPLTSILVILDNLIDDPEMDVAVRQDFIRDIKREITNINFLVQSLLKLSKLDSDTVVFMKEEVAVRRIVDAAVQNVATLCDLKNVQVERDGGGLENVRVETDGAGLENVRVETDGVGLENAEDPSIICDFRWQVEAITNILKNCVEHSPQGSKVLIKTERNSVYTAISIRDFGDGIDEEDQKHIFERFYKGKNASQDSVGIGLALAKAIVEADRGHISVESGDGGTKFVVKYFQV